MAFNLTGREEEYLRRVFPDRPTIGTYSPAKTREFFTGGNILQPDRIDGPLFQSRQVEGLQENGHLRLASVL